MIDGHRFLAAKAKHLGHADAAQTGLKYGACGILTTTWGDNGHFDPLPVAYPGFMAGAALSWNANYDVKDDLTQNLSLHAFNGDANSAKAFYEMGNLYKTFATRTRNCSMFWRLLFCKKTDVNATFTSEELNEAKKQLGMIDITANDKIVAAEAKFVRDMLCLAIKTGRTYLAGGEKSELADDYANMRKRHEEVWLLRNRIGGMSDSAAKLNTDK